MSFTLARSSIASHLCLSKTFASLSVHPVRYASSRSAVWQGLRKERSARRGSDASPSQYSPRRADSSRYDARSASPRSSRERTGLALPAGRKHFKVKKALQKAQEREQDDEGGRKTRSKRFNNPEFDFGKKSLVYQLNKGDMKEKITKLVGDRRARLQGRTSETRSEGAWSALGAASPEERAQPERRGRRDRFNRNDRREQATFHKERSARARAELTDEAPSRYRDERPRQPREDRMENRNRSAEDATSAPRSTDRKRDTMPMTLPYTTAASQFLYGRWPVVAALREGKRKLYNLYVYENSTRQGPGDAVRALAQKRGVPVTVVPEAKQQLLDSMSKGRPHNGLVLEASPLPQLPLEGLGAVGDGGYTVDVAHQSKEDAEINGSETFQRWGAVSKHNPLVVLLHEVVDPGNLGAMLRTARFLGAAAVAITKGTSSPVTTTVVKAAAGAAEELTIFSVADPVTFLEKSRDAGWDSYVAVAPSSAKGSRRPASPEDVARQDPLLEKPCILVLGNEGEGLSRKIISRATHQVTITRQPSLVTSSVDSLNVSVAAALLCDAFTRGMRSAPRTFKDMLMEGGGKTDGESLF